LARDRESLLWAKAVRDIGPAAGVQLIHINDRASDNWDFYQSGLAEGGDWLNRAAQDRRAALGHEASEPSGGLKDLARSLEPLRGRILEVPGHGPAASGTAKLLVSASAVTIFPPWLTRKDQEPMRMWVVRVWEVDAPEGIEPIEWILLTSLPVNTLEEALQISKWYSWRWLIEEYHKCLKTGCAGEKRQLEESDRLEAVLGILAVVAVRLLALKQQVQQRPQTPAVQHVEKLTVQVLMAKRKLRGRLEDLSLHQFWREVAKLGGFLGRRRDGEPGWQTLWRGWSELQLLVEGEKLGLRASERCG
jgi:hypothetical protein